MKSAKNQITSIIGILVFMHFCGDLSAQCAQRIEISNIVIDDQETHVNFDVEVLAKEVFNGQLFRIEGTAQILIRSFSGSGRESFSFADLDLNKDIFYRVIIEYSGEEKFLCRRRVKDIVRTDTK